MKPSVHMATCHGINVSENLQAPSAAAAVSSALLPFLLPGDRLALIALAFLQDSRTGGDRCEEQHGFDDAEGGWLLRRRIINRCWKGPLAQDSSLNPLLSLPRSVSQCCLR